MVRLAGWVNCGTSIDQILPRSAASSPVASRDPDDEDRHRARRYPRLGMGIGLSCRRLDIAEVFSANRLNKLAVDEVIDLRVGFHRLRAGARVRVSTREIKHRTSNIQLATVREGFEPSVPFWGTAL